MALTKSHSRMIAGNMVNVRDFGAVGDGVADDTSAIQAAISACYASGETLYIPTGTYLISDTLDLIDGNDDTIRVMPYNIVGDGPYRTVFNYSGSGVAIELIGRTRYGTIEGGFSVINVGTGTIGLHLRGINYWNTSGAAIHAQGFTDKQIALGPLPAGGGGLWNVFGYLLVEGDDVAPPSYGLYLHPTTNANKFIKVFSRFNYTADCIFVGRSSRNVWDAVSIGTGEDVMTSCIRLDGEQLVSSIEIENENNTSDPGFVAAIIIAANSQVTIFNPTIVGLGNREYDIDATATTMILPLTDVSNPVSGDRSAISTNNGLIISKPRLNVSHENVDGSTSTIGVNGTYDVYVQLSTISWDFTSGTRMVNSIFFTNNTNQTVELQMRMFDSLGSAEPNSVSYIIPSGSTQEVSGRDLDFMLDNADQTQTIRSRFRTSAASFTGTMDYTIGQYKT